MTDIKQHEYDLLNEIRQDSLVTQASLAQRLGMAVGSVNWYVKRLIHRGWIKVSHLDHTRLKYDLTQGCVYAASLLYARDFLKVYSEFREKAKALVSAMKQKGINEANIEGDDEIVDILRLTCIEAGIRLCETMEGITLRAVGQEYQMSSGDSNRSVLEVGNL